MKVIKDIFYTPDQRASQSLDLYLPEGVDGFPTFVYFHGGGIVNGNKAGKTATAISEYLTARGVAVVSINYRLYPHAHYPDFIYDAAASVAWAVKNMP
ncbi:MAG: alpha/beta hydrolase, partial [Clostridia bacterium]|nr:alpha/beta hydrolase [Clostridia bacterium]